MRSAQGWPMRCRSNLFVFAGPFFKFGPAGTDKGLRVRRGHLNRAIPADIDDPTRPGLHLPCYAGGRSQANPKALGVLIALRHCSASWAHICQSSKHPWLGNGRLNQSRNCAVEST